MNTCECCGHDDHYAGVASSTAGPFSISWCRICIAMGAEPAWALEHVAGESLPSMAIRRGISYYDKTSDTYRDARTGEVRPIGLRHEDRGEHIVRKRSDASQFLSEQAAKSDVAPPTKNS